MILAIKDKWRSSAEGGDRVIRYIEIDEIDEGKSREFIENYEETAPEGEYNIDDMLYYLEQKLGYDTNLTVNIVDVFF